MKNKLKVIISTLFLMFFLTSCQSAKDAIKGKTRSQSSDEFLVQKKNPLSMPPDIDKLPVPLEQTEKMPDEVSDNVNLKKKLKVKNENQSIKKSTKSTSLEKKIIEKISE